MISRIFNKSRVGGKTVLAVRFVVVCCLSVGSRDLRDARVFGDGEGRGLDPGFQQEVMIGVFGMGCTGSCSPQWKTSGHL